MSASIASQRQSIKDQKDLYSVISYLLNYYEQTKEAKLVDLQFDTAKIDLLEADRYSSIGVEGNCSRESLNIYRTHSLPEDEFKTFIDRIRCALTSLMGESQDIDQIIVPSKDYSSFAIKTETVNNIQNFILFLQEKKSDDDQTNDDLNEQSFNETSWRIDKDTNDIYGEHRFVRCAREHIRKELSTLLRRSGDTFKKNKNVKYVNQLVFIYDQDTSVFTIKYDAVDDSTRESMQQAITNVLKQWKLNDIFSPYTIAKDKRKNLNKEFYKIELNGRVFGNYLTEAQARSQAAIQDSKQLSYEKKEKYSDQNGHQDQSQQVNNRSKQYGEHDFTRCMQRRLEDKLSVTLDSEFSFLSKRDRSYALVKKVIFRFDPKAKTITIDYSDVEQQYHLKIQESIEFIIENWCEGNQHQCKEVDKVFSLDEKIWKKFKETFYHLEPRYDPKRIYDGIQTVKTPEKHFPEAKKKDDDTGQEHDESKAQDHHTLEDFVLVLQSKTNQALIKKLNGSQGTKAERSLTQVNKLDFKIDEEQQKILLPIPIDNILCESFKEVLADWSISYGQLDGRYIINRTSKVPQIFFLQLGELGAKADEFRKPEHLLKDKLNLLIEAFIEDKITQKESKELLESKQKKQSGGDLTQQMQVLEKIELTEDNCTFITHEKTRHREEFRKYLCQLMLSHKVLYNKDVKGDIQILRADALKLLKNVQPEQLSLPLLNESQLIVNCAAQKAPQDDDTNVERKLLHEKHLFSYVSYLMKNKFIEGEIDVNKVSQRINEYLAQYNKDYEKAFKCEKSEGGTIRLMVDSAIKSKNDFVKTQVVMFEFLKSTFKKHSINITSKVNKKQVEVISEDYEGRCYSKTLVYMDISFKQFNAITQLLHLSEQQNNINNVTEKLDIIKMYLVDKLKGVIKQDFALIPMVEQDNSNQITLEDNLSLLKVDLCENDIVRISAQQASMIMGKVLCLLGAELNRKSVSFEIIKEVRKNKVSKFRTQTLESNNEVQEPDVPMKTDEIVEEASVEEDVNFEYVDIPIEQAMRLLDKAKSNSQRPKLS